MAELKDFVATIQRSNVAPTNIGKKNTITTAGVVVPDVTKSSTYAEAISNVGGIVESINQYRATKD